MWIVPEKMHSTEQLFANQNDTNTFELKINKQVNTTPVLYFTGLAVDICSREMVTFILYLM